MSPKRPVSLFALLLGLAGSLAAQDASDVYLATVVPSEGGVRLESITALTDRDGYDNQPSFLSNDIVLYTSIRDGQADIWAVDPAQGRTWQVTDTPESEYSPTPIPGDQAISVVRVEPDGTQRLWRFPLDEGNTGEPSLILEDIKPVGYHAWYAAYGKRQLALFVLGEPMHLVRTASDEPKATGRTVAQDIGRALHRIPGEAAYSFVQKTGETLTLMRLDVEGDQATPLFTLFPGREDLTWSPDGWVWTADGKLLYRRRPGDADWQQVADLSSQVRGAISRMAISPDGKRLAFVAAR